jgi:hypothetical protein
VHTTPTHAHTFKIAVIPLSAGVRLLHLTIISEYLREKGTRLNGKIIYKINKEGTYLRMERNKA